MDLNIVNKATLSDGTVFPNPRLTKKHAAKLKRAQQQVARKVKGSANRTKAKAKVARLQQHIGNARKDGNHKDSTTLIRHYDEITFEDLQILNLVKNSKLAKHILDVGWGQLRELTTSKAGNADRRIKSRHPAYTSQDCCICGHRQSMPLSVRVFTCERCANVLPRDQNAALNIEQGVARMRTPVERSAATGKKVSAPQARSPKQEQARKNKSDSSNRTLQLDLFPHP